MTSARPNYTQIREEIAAKLKEAKRILIVTHTNPDADALGAGLAVATYLTAMGKHTDIFTYGNKPGPVPSNLDFLPQQHMLKHNRRLTREFVIKVDRKQSDLTGLRYEADDDGLEIFLSPGEGGITPGSISFEQGEAHYDLVVALDVDSFERMGKAGEVIREQFADIELINIDHHGTNTRFGAHNLVISGASSSAELVWTILELLGEKNVTPEIATLLLTGIMADTGGLQHSNASQRTIEVVGKLVGKGADRETITRKLFQEKSLPVLRLWGKILSNLHIEGRSSLAWSSLSFADLSEENSDEIDSGALLSNLLSGVKEAQVVLLLIERQIGRVQVSLRSPGGSDVSKFAADHGGGGHALAAGFTIEDTSLEDIEHRLVPELIDYLKQQQKAVPRQASQGEPKPASRSGEVVDIFEEAEKQAKAEPKPKEAQKAAQPAPRQPVEPEVAEIPESEPELSADPDDYIAEGGEVPFSANEYTAPKDAQGEIGVWTPGKQQ
jgi:phosphoesterase RecJ-like protein